MQVREIMSKYAVLCRADAPLSEVARLMEQRDCGFIPLTDGSGKKLVGVVTDRDICFAAYRLQEPLDQLDAKSAMTKRVHSCVDTDELGLALDIMKRHAVRRLPVLDRKGEIVGVLSLDDVARAAADHGRAPSFPDVCEAFKAIATPRPRRILGSTRAGEASEIYTAPEVE